MSEKLNNDATPQIVGIIYQFYIAIEKCFEMITGEKIFIEKYGDITISENKQIEIKNYEEPLTDLHENIWNTLNNWLLDKFDSSHYKALILLTTQEFGEKSSFKDWNTKSLVEKKNTLDLIMTKYNIRTKKSKETEKLLQSVLASDKTEKLEKILEKFVILCSEPKEYEYYNMIKDRYGKNVLSINRDEFIYSILGYIISPEIIVDNKWEITYEEFTEKVIMLTKIFCSGTVIFPKKYTLHYLSEDEIKEKSGFLFVKKIKDINYNEVICDAISDYIVTNKTIFEDLSKHSISKKHYEEYEKELENIIRPCYRIALRNTTNENIINNSKDFYDEIMCKPAPNFLNYNDTPIYFKNGIIHNMADDEKKNIKWRLETDKNE